MPTNTSVTRQEGGAAADVSLRQPPTESSQERILSAATQLFLNQGYEKTSIDEIGVAAGLSGPAIYYHFRSKSDLLLRVVDRAQESSSAGDRFIAGSRPGPVGRPEPGGGRLG